MEHFIQKIDWKLIGEKNDYAEAYKSYQKESERNGNKEPILDMTAFKSLSTQVKRIDRKQRETIKSNRVYTSLYIEREESEEVDTYCLLLEEK